MQNETLFSGETSRDGNIGDLNSESAAFLSFSVSKASVHRLSFISFKKSMTILTYK